MFAFFIVFVFALFVPAVLAVVYSAARQHAARVRCYRRHSLPSLMRGARARAIARHYLPPLLLLFAVGMLASLADGGLVSLASTLPIVAVRNGDSRRAGWLTAKVGDILTADGWSCATNNPHYCGSGLYGWQVLPAPTTVQREGWSGSRGADWVAWVSGGDDVAFLAGKVASYHVKIVREACGPIEMAAFVRGIGGVVPPALAESEREALQARWGWIGTLARLVAREALYQCARANGWPVERDDVLVGTAYHGGTFWTTTYHGGTLWTGGTPWAHPLSRAVAVGGWTPDGERARGVAYGDADEALRTRKHVSAVFITRMLRDYGKLVSARTIRQHAKRAESLALAEQAIRALAERAVRKESDRAVAIDRSWAAEHGLRPAERGMGARSARRRVAVWYRGAVVGWVTPHRAGSAERTTVGALRRALSRVRRRVPTRDGGEEARIIARAQAIIDRRRGNWKVEQYRVSGGGWGHSAAYGRRVVNYRTGEVIATWGRGSVPPLHAALQIIDADRVLRGAAR